MSEGRGCREVKTSRKKRKKKAKGRGWRRRNDECDERDKEGKKDLGWQEDKQEDRRRLRIGEALAGERGGGRRGGEGAESEWQ